MTFGDLFRGIRLHRLLDGSNRKEIRDHIRGTRKRNDGRQKDMASARMRRRNG